jgi:signal transduction histidine kinase
VRFLFGSHKFGIPERIGIPFATRSDPSGTRFQRLASFLFRVHDVMSETGHVTASDKGRLLRARDQCRHAGVFPLPRTLSSNGVIAEPPVNVLLVDDNAGNLAALEAILDDLKLNLVKAHSGDEALRQLLTTEFAVVLLDVQMPCLDGFETARLMRGREKLQRTPIIFLTAAESDRFPVVEGYELGAVDFLVKPFDPVVMKAKVTVFVELFRMASNLQREISEHQRTAAELRRSNQELEQFAYVASHDLKEPLRKIRIYLQLLEQRYKGQLDDRADQYIAYAVDSAGRMQALVQDVLTYARVGRLANPTGLAESAIFFDQAVASLQPAIQESHAVVTRSHLPSVRAHGTQLVQLFVNLLGNALKFRREQAPVIQVEAVALGSDWRFAVHDNGIGIDPQYAERIFAPFERLHSQNEYPGTGIGLAICKKIVEGHGGRIWVESVPGKGATFYFSLPGNKEPES